MKQGLGVRQPLGGGWFKLVGLPDLASKIQDAQLYFQINNE